MKLASWYGIVVGVLMAIQWVFFLAIGQVPEISTEPWSIGFHLAAEFCTAAALIVAGIFVLKGNRKARILLAASLGMVIYSEIASPGYFAQLGNWPLVGMFAVLLVLAIVALVRLVLSTAMD